MRSRIVTTVMTILIAFSSLPLLAPTVSAGDTDHDLILTCDDNYITTSPFTGIATMDQLFRLNTAGVSHCGSHVGVHTWYLGHLGSYKIDAGSHWRAKVVETSLAPTGVGQALYFEVSLDGLSWTQVHKRTFTPNSGELWIPSSSTHETIPASSDEFRFLRVRLEKAQDGGIAGYIDGIYIGLEVIQQSTTGIPTRSGTSFSCAAADIVEDLFPTHPCWYGDDDGAFLPGIVNADPVLDRGWYVSSSYTHTYAIGPHTVNQVSGTVAAAVFRFFLHPQCAALSPLVSGADVVDATISPVYTTVHVQTSVNGRNWSTVGTVEVLSSVPNDPDDAIPGSTVLNQASYSFSTGGGSVNFVRLITQLSNCFDDGGASERHDAYLLDSTLNLS